MVRKRLWPPSSSFCSDCSSCLTRPTGTKAANDFTATSSVSMAFDRTEISRIGERDGRQLLRAELLDLADLEGESLERGGDHAGEEVDDHDLQGDREQAEDQQAFVVATGTRR